MVFLGTAGQGLPHVVRTAFGERSECPADEVSMFPHLSHLPRFAGSRASGVDAGTGKAVIGPLTTANSQVREALTPILANPKP